jgi:small subunit ribosomal protein S6
VNVYENVVILDASLSDEAIEASTGKVKDLITGSGGEILKVDPWGKRKLAYEIKKQSRGFYLLFLFKAPAAAIKTMEDFFKVYDPVVKYLFIRLEKKQRDAALNSLAEAPPEAAPAPAQEAQQ